MFIRWLNSLTQRNRGLNTRFISVIILSIFIACAPISISHASIPTWKVVAIPGDHDAIASTSCYSLKDCVGVSAFSGQVIISKDAGNSWVALHPRNVGRFGFTSVKCLKTKFCLATGQLGAMPSVGAGIYTSQNGGINWGTSLKVLSPNNPKFRFSDISCPTADVCLVSGTTGSKGVIYRTENSGEFWKSIVLPKQPPNGAIQAMSCPTSKVCYAVQGSKALVYKSLNGGLTWKSQLIPDSFNLFKNNKETPTGLDAISCGSVSFCVAGGFIAHINLQGTTQPIKWVTTNGGKSWYFTNSFASTGAKSTSAVSVHGIGCATNHDCTIGIFYGQVFKTTDAGKRWTRDQSVPSPNNNVLSMNCVTNSHCIVTVISIFPQKSFTSGQIWINR